MARCCKFKGFQNEMCTFIFVSTVLEGYWELIAVIGTVGKLCFSTFRKTKHFLLFPNFRRRKTANIVRTLIKNRTLSERELTKSGSKCQISRKWSDAAPQNFNSAQRKYLIYFIPILVQISRYMTFHLIYPWNVSAYGRQLPPGIYRKFQVCAKIPAHSEVHQ